MATTYVVKQAIRVVEHDGRIWAASEDLFRQAQFVSRDQALRPSADTIAHELGIIEPSRIVLTAARMQLGRQIAVFKFAHNSQFLAEEAWETFLRLSSVPPQTVDEIVSAIKEDVGPNAPSPVVAESLAAEPRPLADLSNVPEDLRLAIKEFRNEIAILHQSVLDLSKLVRRQQDGLAGVMDEVRRRPHPAERRDNPLKRIASQLYAEAKRYEEEGQ